MAGTETKDQPNEPAGSNAGTFSVQADYLLNDFDSKVHRGDGKAPGVPDVTIANSDVTVSSDGSAVSQVKDKTGATHNFDKETGKWLSSDYPDGRHVEPTGDGGQKITYKQKVKDAGGKEEEVTVTERYGADRKLQVRDMSNGRNEMYLPDGSRIITAPDKTVYQMDSANRCTKVTYPNGSSVEQVWRDGQISELRQSDGNTFKFENGKWNHYHRSTDTGKEELLGSSDYINVVINGDSGPHTGQIRGTITDARMRQATSGLSAEEFEQRDKTLRDLHDLIKSDDAATNPKTKAAIENMIREMGASKEKQHDAMLRYQDLFGVTLQHDLENAHLHVATRLAVRQRDDQGTEPDRAREALEALQSGSGERSVNAKQLRCALDRMTAKEIAALEGPDHLLSKQLEQLHRDGTLSHETYDSLKLMVANPADSEARKHPEYYAQLAKIGLGDSPSYRQAVEDAPPSRLGKLVKRADSEERIELLREALGKQTSTEQEAVRAAAREQIKQSGLQKDLELTMPHRGLMEVQEILNKGEAGIITRVLQNNGVWDNANNIEHNLTEVMTQKERDDYRSGMDLKNQLDRRQIEESKLTPQQREQLQFYRDLHDALLKSAGTMSLIMRSSETMDMHKWEDLALHGKPTLESRIAGHYGLLFNDGPGWRQNEMANISKEDWERIKNEPGYAERLKKTHADLVAASPTERTIGDLLNRDFDQMIDKLKAAESYEQARNNLPIGLASLSPINGNKPEEVISALTNATPQQLAHLRNNDLAGQTMRRVLQEQIDSLPDDGSKQAAKRLQEQLLRGEQPKLGGTELALLEAGKLKRGEESPTEYARNMEKIMRGTDLKDREAQLESEHQSGKIKDAEYQREKRILTEMKDQRDKLFADLKSNNQTSPEAKLLKDVLAKAPVASSIMNDLLSKGGLTGQHLKDMCTDMVSAGEGAPPVAVINFEKYANSTSLIDVTERKRLLELAEKNPTQFEREFPGVTREQRDFIKERLKNPSEPITLDEQMRMYMLTSGGSEKMRDMLTQLTPYERIHMAEAYERRYGSSLSKDLAQRAPEGLANELLRLAAPENNRFEEAMQAIRSVEEQLKGPGAHMTAFLDSSNPRWKEMLQKLVTSTNEAERQKIRETLAHAVADQIATTNDLADKALDGAAVATWLAAPAISPLALAAIGALVKPGVRYSLQPNAYGNYGENFSTALMVDAASGFLGGYAIKGADGPVHAALGRFMQGAARETGQSLVAKMTANEVAHLSEQKMQTAVAELMVKTFQRGAKNIQPQEYIEALMKAGLDRTAAERLGPEFGKTIQKSLQHGSEDWAKAHGVRLMTQQGVWAGLGAADAGVQGSQSDGRALAAARAKDQTVDMVAIALERILIRSVP